MADVVCCNWKLPNSQIAKIVWIFYWECCKSCRNAFCFPFDGGSVVRECVRWTPLLVLTWKLPKNVWLGKMYSNIGVIFIMDVPSWPMLTLNRTEPYKSILRTRFISREREKSFIQTNTSRKKSIKCYVFSCISPFGILHVVRKWKSENHRSVFSRYARWNENESNYSASEGIHASHVFYNSQYCIQW